MKFGACGAIFSPINLPRLFSVGDRVFDAALNSKAGVRAAIKKQHHRITDELAAETQ
jgi:hypothetical protein